MIYILTAERHRIRVADKNPIKFREKVHPSVQITNTFFSHENHKVGF